MDGGRPPRSDFREVVGPLIDDHGAEGGRMGDGNVGNVGCFAMGCQESAVGIKMPTQILQEK